MDRLPAESFDHHNHPSYSFQTNPFSFGIDTFIIIRYNLFMHEADIAYFLVRGEEKKAAFSFYFPIVQLCVVLIIKRNRKHSK